MAGVSIATVSRVLSRPQAVSPPTRRKVLQAVEELGYTTNAAGKQLRTQRSGKLLVIVPDVSNPFYSRVLQSIEAAAQREGYAVVMGDTQHDRVREARYTLMLRQREADGLIVLGHGLPEAPAALSAELSRGAAIVAGCEVSDQIRTPTVRIDNQAAAREVMDHLYALGHCRIGIITGPTVSPLSRDRLHGVLGRAQIEQAEGDLTICHGDFTTESGEREAERLLSGRDAPTALFCFNDQMAFGALGVAWRRGLRVPDDVSVVGFDDITFAGYTYPPLTTVAQPVRDMGEELVRLLLGRIRNQAIAPVSVVLPHELVVRGSTAPPKSDRRS